ncbi:hypothetical protein PPTG_03057 [Phytophthora nicotianae INRA-310]|uniref:Uncharacterized protein n=1 Tax=Phytophthora nicotianae (strain INRA-310) TaxID=761204 RepID=W2R3I6_PHYN3|nr:hypothetical protein PPTG_03057 [Phytophthora nicotianae INRA-310]ETN19948.1 hypothetical protein PPTG_03057 [Phytophthora nicotianae INRA-310]
MNLLSPDGEAHETLQAALAFIDECGDVLFSDENSSSPGEFDSTNVTWNNITLNSNVPNQSTTKTITRSRPRAQLSKRNVSRDRQKLEILRLRAEAELLQNRIADMKKIQEAAEKECVNATSHVVDSTSEQPNDLLFGVWKGLAKKSRRLRREADAENRYLCGLYNDQMTTIETLRRLLQMQEQVKVSVYLRNYELASNPRWSTWYYVHSTFDTDDNVLAAINRLHGDLGQLFAETDRAFMSNGLEACMSPFAFANVNTTSDTTSYIEVLFCRILPFDHNTVGDCFWHEMIKYDVENAVERGQSQREAKAAAVS